VTKDGPGSDKYDLVRRVVEVPGSKLLAQYSGLFFNIHEQDENPTEENKGLAGGAIAGIAIAVIAVVAAAIVIAVIVVRRKRKGTEPKSEEGRYFIDTSVASG
jgi:orotate phosphoribosyltransferase